VTGKHEDVTTKILTVYVAKTSDRVVAAIYFIVGLLLQNLDVKIDG